MLRWLSLIVALVTPGIPGAGEADAQQTGIINAYPDAPPFTVRPRQDAPDFDECSDCHEEGDTDPEPRKLRTKHVREIHHGGNRFWCLTCHNGDKIDRLRTSGNENVDVDKSYLICGSCHADRQRDWYFGGHGKRVSGWQEERVIRACTECHDPHKPAVKPRPPKPRPPVRARLERQELHMPETTRIWEH